MAGLLTLPPVVTSFSLAGRRARLEAEAGGAVADDAAQVRAARAGDRAAFGELYQRYSRMVHGLLLARVPPADADDLTQEVFTKAYVAWNDLYDRENLSSWLYRIATNLCIDQLRRRKRISWWPLARRSNTTEQLSGDEELSYLPPDTGGIPEIAEREHIRLALASIPADYAIVLVLNAAQGVPYQEIGTIVGISPNAAATRISRAKRLFAEQYTRLSGNEAAKRRRRDE